jgi:hypothetical protein
MNINPTVNDAFFINDFKNDQTQKLSFPFVENEPNLSYRDQHIPFNNTVIPKKKIVINQD